jgi:hypothetical protein
MKFRKKPVVIDAWRVADMTWVEVQALDPQGGITALGNRVGPESVEGFQVLGYNIRTLEGTMTALPDDWIIRGVQGEFYPCKPEIFAATYEEYFPPCPMCERPMPHTHSDDRSRRAPGNGVTLPALLPRP